MRRKMCLERTYRVAKISFRYVFGKRRSMNTTVAKFSKPKVELTLFRVSKLIQSVTINETANIQCKKT